MADRLSPDGKRICVIGKTGSGKTALARELLSGSHKAVAVCDTKQTFTWPQAPDAVIVNNVTDLTSLTLPRIIWRPNMEERGDPEAFEAFFRWIYDRKMTLVDVDEVYQIVFNRMGPRWYNQCITQGRELGIDVMSCTQRPAYIPPFVLSEADEYYVFHLNDVRDRKRLAGILGNELMLSPRDAYRAVLQQSNMSASERKKVEQSPEFLYSFWHYSHEMERPKLRKGVNIRVPNVQPTDISTRQGSPG